MVLSFFYILHASFWFIQNQCLYRVRSRSIISFFCTWIPSFPISLIRHCPFFKVCSCCFCKKNDIAKKYMRLFRGSLFVALVYEISIDHSQNVYYKNIQSDVDGEQGKLSIYVCRNVNYVAGRESTRRLLKHLQIERSCDTLIPLLGRYPKKRNQHFQKVPALTCLLQHYSQQQRYRIN